MAATDATQTQTSDSDDSSSSKNIIRITKRREMMNDENEFTYYHQVYFSNVDHHAAVVDASTADVNIQ
jgi:hypothetical protein